MTTFLLEKFWTLLILGLLLSGLAFHLAGQRRTAFWRWAGRIVPLVFAVLLVINYFVVTDREAIQGRIDRIIAACKTGDVEDLRPLLADDFSATGLTKSDLLDAIKEVFDRLQINSVRLMDVVNNPPYVQLRALTNVVSKRGGMNFDWVDSEWKLTFKRSGDAWLLFDIQPIKFYKHDVGTMQEVLRESHQAP